MKCLKCNSEYTNIDKIPLCHSCYIKLMNEEEKTLNYTKQELVNLVKHLILNMEVLK